MTPAGQSASTNSADQNKQLADQVTDLRAQVARLQAAVEQNGYGSKTSAKPGMKMSPAPGKSMAMTGEMGMAPKAGMAMKDDQGEMGAMPAAGKAPMPMGDDKDEMAGMAMGGKSKMSPAPAAAMGMCCGGESAAMPPAAGAMAGMSGSSAMPGQAGASHLYHIGSNGFFLNHSQHITLTADQKLALNRLKEKAMLDRAYEQRRIDQGEQELYTLTGADQLDNAKVQAKIVEIEKLRAEQRMNFIRAVSDASNVLTHDQHLALLGTMPAMKK
jgi:Spy/CpxP family protein refolding chaperone